MLDTHQRLKHAEAAAKAMKVAIDLLKTLRAQDDDYALDDAGNHQDDASVQLSAYIDDLKRVAAGEDDAEMYGPKMIPRHRGVFARLTGEAA